MIGVLYAVWRTRRGRLGCQPATGALARGSSWIEHAETVPAVALRGTRPAPPRRRSAIRYWCREANLYYAAMHMTTWMLILPDLAVRPASRAVPADPAGDGLDHPGLPARAARSGGAAANASPGIVNTGLIYNQSVYSHGLAHRPLSAMPSVHVAWACARRLVRMAREPEQVAPSSGRVHAVVMTLVRRGHRESLLARWHRGRRDPRALRLGRVRRADRMAGSAAAAVARPRAG